MDLLKVKYKVHHKDAWVVFSTTIDRLIKENINLKEHIISFPYGNNPKQLTPIIKESSRTGTKDNK